MLTESERRAFRARQLLDSGKDPREVAREMGYTKVSGMLGAITLSEARVKRRGEVFENTAYPKKEIDLSAVSELLKEGHPDPAGPPGEPGIPHGQMTPMTREEHEKAHCWPKNPPTTRLYPMENGVITVPKGDVSVSWKPKAQTAFINVNNYRQAKWLPLYGNIFGGRQGLAQALRQIAEAATEAAALIEEEEHVDHYAR